MGDGVVCVEDVEALAAVQVQDPRHDREVVRGGVEQGVGAALCNMDLDRTGRSREARGHVVREQVDPVAVLGERQRQLARYDAGAAIGGVTEE